MVFFLLHTMTTNSTLMANKSRAIIPPTTPRTIGSRESGGFSCFEVGSAVSGYGSVASEVELGNRYTIDTILKRTGLYRFDTIAVVLVVDAMVV